MAWYWFIWKLMHFYTFVQSYWTSNSVLIVVNSNCVGTMGSVNFILKQIFLLFIALHVSKASEHIDDVKMKDVEISVKEVKIVKKKKKKKKRK